MLARGGAEGRAVSVLDQKPQMQKVIAAAGAAAARAAAARTAAARAVADTGHQRRGN